MFDDTHEQLRCVQVLSLRQVSLAYFSFFSLFPPVRIQRNDERFFVDLRPPLLGNHAFADAFRGGHLVGLFNDEHHDGNHGGYRNDDDDSTKDRKGAMDTPGRKTGRKWPTEKLK